MTGEVNGLKLPASLLRAMQAGRWPPMTSADALRTVFNDEPALPQFFGLDDIVAINRTWANEDRPEFVGTPGSDGNIDPATSLLVGQLGPDQLIALSYQGDSAPVILYLTAELETRWEQVAANVDELLARLQRADSTG